MDDESGAEEFRTDASGADEFASQVTGVSLLADPVRRALYEYVVAQPGPVGRVQAAQATGVPDHTVKFHLDKLVEAGLLVPEFRRLTGRSGPGAGRPSKLYRRSAKQVELSLPRRQYELAGQVLAAAVTRAAHDSVPVLDAVRETAHQTGRDLPAGTRVAADGADEFDVVAGTLAEVGYEPRPDGDRLTLANCPFHGLVDHNRSLVCTMNLALLDGVLEGLGCQHASARLDPAPGRCCVTVVRRATA